MYNIIQIHKNKLEKKEEYNAMAKTNTANMPAEAGEHTNKNIML